MMELKNYLLRFFIVAAMICLPQIASADATPENGSDTLLLVDSLSLQAKSITLSASTTAKSSDTIKVKTASEFHTAVRNNPNGKIALCDDISFTGTDYEDDDNIAESFSGSIFTVAGADTIYALKGLKCNVFDEMSGANIHDIIIKDFSFDSNDTHTGTIASVAEDCTFSDIVLSDVSLGEYDGVVIQADRAGGLVGDASDCTFKNIVGGNVVIHINGYKAGGVAGHADNCTFSNCMMDARCVIYSDGTWEDNNAYSGGICGYANGCTVDSCYVYGIVGGDDDRVGGIVGGANGSTAITHCSTAGLVTQTTFDNLGDYKAALDKLSNNKGGAIFFTAFTGIGFIGTMPGAIAAVVPFSLPIALAAASVLSLGIAIYNANYSDEVGGIAGWCGPGTNIDRCTNYATIQSMDAYSGGICGYFDGNRITNCRNYGYVVGDEDVGGIAGRADAPTISGCVNFGNIKGDSDTGGLVGYGNISNMHDCVNAGNITFTDDDDEDVGGLCGHIYPGDSDHTNVTFERCFNYGCVNGGGEKNGECTMGINSGITENSKYLCLKDGEAFNNFTNTECQQLTNGVYAKVLTSKSGSTDDEYNIEWYQDIDANTTGFTYPVPRPANGNYTGTDRIMLNVLCDGTTTYSNRFNSKSEHTAVDDGTHHCNICGNVIVTEEDAAAGITPIYTAADITRLAHQVNCGISGQKVMMYKDIDMKDVEKYIPVGVPAAPFKGTFDGQFNKIKNLNFTAEPFNHHAAVFGSIGNGCTISRLIVDSSCSFTTSNSGAAGIAGGVYSNPKASCSATIVKCGNEANISASYNAAGILGGVYNNDNAVITIENCYNTGSITGDKENAAICAWARKNYTINNCWNSGVVTGIESGRSFVRYVDYHAMSNCYSTAESQTSVTTITNSEVSSGELCWILDGSDNSSTDDIWHQHIGNDKHPVFIETDDNKVYQNLYCDNKYAYTNKLIFTDADRHSFNDDGICLRVSGEVHGAEPDYDDVNKVWNITKPGHLYWIADKVNNNTSSESYNCNLINDIVVNKNVIVYGYLNSDADAVAAFLPWTPIGDETAYDGTFNGNGHTISGLYINGDRTKYTGLFGTIFEGANVSNLGVTDCYFNVTSGIGVGALAGAITYGDISPSITNCYTTGIINGAQDVGGLVGDIYGTEKVNISNCYSQCKVKGTNSEKLSSVGALVGYGKSGAKISSGVKNCYYTARNTNGENKCGTDKSPLAFRTGEVCQLLNNGQERNFWAQELETTTAPLLGTTDVTYERNMSYRWGSLILPFKVSSNGAVQYYTVKNLDSNNNLHLTAVDKVDANTPCFFRVAEGTEKFSVAASADGYATPEDEIVRTENNGISFIGLYVQDNINGSNGYYLAHDKLWLADTTADAYVTSYRAYLLPANSNAKSINIISPEDEITAIGEITDDGVNIYDGPVYNIAGQKLNALQKGQINIVNGKKVMVK